MKKSVVAFAVLMLVAMNAFASFQWKPEVLEGYINAGTSWNGDVAPGSGDSIVSTHSSGDYTVRFPAADYVPGFLEMQFLLTGKTSITVDGRGGTFAMPVLSGGQKYGAVPFSFRTATSGGLILDFEDWSTQNIPIFWTNAYFKVERTDSSMSKAAIDFEWNGGDLVARDFTTGMTLAIPTAKAYNYRFHAGTVVLPAVKLGCNATDGLLFETDGATVDAACLQFPGGSKTIGAYAPTNRVHVTGTGTLSTRKSSSASFGSSNATADNVFMLEADNGGKISLAGHAHSSPGTLFFNIHDNGTLEYSAGISAEPMWSNGDGADTVVRITDSTLLFNAYGTYGSAHTGRIDFRAERSTILSSCGEYFQGGDYVLTDCAYTNTGTSGMSLGGSSSAVIAGCVARMTLVNSTLNHQTLYVGNYGGEGHLTMTGGVAFCSGLLFLSYQNKASKGEIVLTQGAELNSGSTFGIGVNGLGVMTVEKGAALKNTSSSANQFSLGAYGTGVGRMTVDDASVDILSGALVGGQGVGVLTLTNGATFKTTKVTVANAATGTGTVNLDGGCLQASLEGGDGTSALFANGGTVKAVSASSTIASFGTAKIGSKGLTIDNGGFDITVSQAFTAAEDETSVLILKGDGEKGGTTLTGDLSGVDTLVADSGAVDLSGLAINDLVATNTAVLTVTPGTAIVISGSATFANVRFALATPVEVGTTYDIFTVGTALSSESVAALGEALVLSGAGDLVVDFLAEDNGTGGSLVKAVVRLPQTTELRLDSGTVTNAADHINKPADSFAVIVGTDADLTLSGTLKRGSLVKTGGGAATVTSSGNEFVNGIVIDGGLFAASEVAALGGADVTLRAGTFALGTAGAEPEKFDGKLTLAAATAATAVGIRTDSDVSMSVPTVNNGLIVKTGAGALAFEAERNTTLVKSSGALGTGGKPEATVTRSTNAGDFAPEADKFGGLGIVEGEMRLSATSQAVEYTLEPPILLGVNTPEGEACAANPRLTVTDCKLKSFQSGHNAMYMASGIAPAAALTGATLSLSNTYFDVSSLWCGYGSAKDGLDFVIAATDATCRIEWAFYYAHAASEGNTYRYNFKNSQLCVGQGGLDNMLKASNPGTAVFDFDNSVLANAAGTGLLKYWRATWSSIGIDARFRNGSILRCEDIFLNTQTPGLYNLRFDGGFWEVDAALVTSEPVSTSVIAEGAGLKLAPPSGKTWTLYQPITGEGAIVKEGAGTLAVAPAAKARIDDKYIRLGIDPIDEPATLLNAGGLELNAGTVQFLPDAVVPAGLKIKATGAATLKDAALANAVIAVNPAADPANVLTFAGCTFAGRTQVDFGGAVAAAGDAFTLFAYTGTAPDVSKLRAVNLTNADGERLCGTFRAEGGVITMTATPTPGILLIVR